jgi:uncharacterized protein (TIGR03382 family)
LPAFGLVFGALAATRLEHTELEPWVMAAGLVCGLGFAASLFERYRARSLFEVDLWSIDLAGNVSETARRVSVHIDRNSITNPDAGTQGCSAMGSTRGGSPLLLLVLGWQLRRRRRASRAMP